MMPINAASALDFWMAPLTHRPVHGDLRKLFLFKPLVELAAQVLCTPSSSAAAERVFSQMGILLNHRRNRLSDANVKAEVLFQANRHFLLDRPKASDTN